MSEQDRDQLYQVAATLKEISKREPMYRNELPIVGSHIRKFPSPEVRDLLNKIRSDTNPRVVTYRSMPVESPEEAFAILEQGKSLEYDGTFSDQNYRDKICRCSAKVQQKDMGAQLFTYVYRPDDAAITHSQWLGWGFELGKSMFNNSVEGFVKNKLYQPIPAFRIN